MLLYWRPSVTGRYSQLFALLEAEIADLAARLDDQPVRLLSRATSSLLDDWSADNRPWLRAHASQLRVRYDRPLGDERR